MSARRDPARRRRGPVREPRTRLLVYCGGLRTEPAYFDEVRLSFPGGAVSTEVRAKGVGPNRLITLAARYAGNPGFYDEVWCVVDVDGFDLESAARLAKRSGVRLAVSNPCFELWLLLHREGYIGTSYVDGYDDAVTRLRSYLPGYDKRQLNFADFAAGVSQAIEKAKALDPEKNPSSGVWRLVEKMMEQQ